MQHYSYNFDDYEQALRFFFLGIQCTKLALDLQKVSQGMLNVEGLSEGDFQQFLANFTKEELNLNLSYLIQTFKQIRKINKRILEIILKILEVTVTEVTSENGSTSDVIDY